VNSFIQTIATAEYLSSHHTANALGFSQPSVSARIRALGEGPGILLSKRGKTGVRLIDARWFFVELTGDMVAFEHCHLQKISGDDYRSPATQEFATEPV
jgi:DNA-binding transcriptional LysR family regulator